MDWITMILEMAVDVLEKWWTASLHGPNQKVFGHRRSIVRLIGTMLPLPRAQRVHLDLAVWRYNNDHDLVSSDAKSVSSISDSTDEGWVSVSTEAGKVMQNNDMKKLMEEILELKIKMNEILQRQTLNICCGQSTCCSVGTAHRPTDRPANPPPPPPPPPPPLPPPMPQFRLQHSTPKRVEKRSPVSCDPQKPDGLSAVLSELKKSQFTLKPVQRSPGGRPLKDSDSESRTPRADCGGDMLAEILRRRLSHTQYSDSDCSISSVHSDFYASPDRHYHL